VAYRPGATRRQAIFIVHGHSEVRVVSLHPALNVVHHGALMLVMADEHVAMLGWIGRALRVARAAWHDVQVAQVQVMIVWEGWGRISLWGLLCP
jgi:hypothetical protein